MELPHAALAVLYGADRCTITRAVHEVRPLLAARGFAVSGCPDLRLQEGHRHRRREGPYPVGRGVPARSHARPDGCEDRGDLRPV
nr:MULTISPECIES: hypothetical protein [unclassified Streptomyces]